MVMEADQEVMTRLSSFKGKRTKRQRPVSPLGLPIISYAGESGTGDSRIMSTPTTSVDDSSVIGGVDKLEEEDMANCLMLLAQGSREAINREFSPTTVRAKPPTSESGVYRCKTCNRSFPSFQALGGHRASHKKPNNKLDNEGNKIKPERSKEEYHDQQNGRFLENPMSTTLSLQISNSTMMNASKANYSNKIHECSVCGAEFSSGQALGGHMRRHRATNSTAASPAALIAPAISLASSSNRNDQPEFQESKQPRNILQLDLNLPAETEEENLVKESNKFHFPTKEQVLVFSANSLVDCHY